MKNRLLVAPVVALLLAATAGAQIPANVTLGPNPAPRGSAVSVTISNDGPFFFSVTGCPIEVFNAGMELIWTPSCNPSAIAVGPFGWITFYWPQVNMHGEAMPPGDYWMKVSYDFQGPTFHPFTIDASVGAGLVLEGTASIGDTLTFEDRHFYLTAPQDGGYLYWLFGSFSANVGIPLCSGTLPLDNDLLFKKSAVAGKIFKSSIGTLSPQGTTVAPKFPIPNDPDLVGIPVVAAFVVLDLAAPCVFRRISGTHAMTIL